MRKDLVINIEVYSEYLLEDAANYTLLVLKPGHHALTGQNS